MAARRARPAKKARTPGTSQPEPDEVHPPTGVPLSSAQEEDPPVEPVLPASGTPPAPAIVEGEVVRTKPARKPRKAAATPAPVVEPPPEAPQAEPLPEQVAAAVEGLIEPAELAPLEDVAADELAIVPVEKPGTVARRDPLQAYMAEVRRHPLLTREQEIELARRFRDAGDVRAAYTLVASNLRLVVKLAHEYHRNPLALLDLIQEGNIGLMQAVKKFDPERGVKLASYAAWWIRAYILRYIMDNWKMVKLGTTEAQRKLFFKLRQEQERLRSQGYEVTPKLLADRLNVTEQDVIEMDQRLGQDELSLDAPLGREDEGKETRVDRMLSTAQPAADDALGTAQLKELFRERLKAFAETLTDKERLVFEKRLMADEPMTLQDIGAQWGVSRERARQIEAALIERMRQYMRTHIPDFDLVAAEEHD